MNQGTNLTNQMTRSVVSGPLHEIRASRPTWPSSLPNLSGKWGVAEVNALLNGTQAPGVSPEGVSAADSRVTLSRSLFPDLARIAVAPPKRSDSRIMVIDSREKSSSDTERYRYLLGDGWREGPMMEPISLASGGLPNVALGEILDRIESLGVPTRAVIRRHSRDEALTDWVILVRQRDS